jgi:hypothetical protein
VHLYIPKNKHAHKVTPATRDALARILSDDFHVWANVDFEKWEFDWLVFDARKGWFGIYEEKRPHASVAETFSTGQKWILGDGSQIENPYDQVGGHADRFRAYVRRELCPRYFESFDERELKVYRGVLCPAITDETILIKPRFGLVFRDEETLARAVSAHSPHVKLRPKNLDSFPRLIDHLNHDLKAQPTKVRAGASASSPLSAPKPAARDTQGDLLEKLVRDLLARVAVLEAHVGIGASAAAADANAAIAETNGTPPVREGKQKGKGSGKYSGIERRLLQAVGLCKGADRDAARKWLASAFEWLSRDPKAVAVMRENGFPVSLAVQIARHGISALEDSVAASALVRERVPALLDGRLVLATNANGRGLIVFRDSVPEGFAVNEPSR